MDDLVVAYSGNLSRGGLFLKSEELLPVGTVVTITIELPDGGPELKVPCSVVFARDTDVRGMGVKFNDPDEQTKQRIEAFIISAAASMGEPEAGQKPRILDIVVIDDDPIQSARAAESFRSRGHTVRTARDGLEGLALCLKKTPDVVLTDVQMPKMDGWQLVRMLRARPAFAKVPIIFLTTLKSEEDRLLGYRLGVDDYLPKPYELSELASRVDRVVLRAEKHEKEAAADGRSLTGDLEQVGLPSILSFLEVERRSGELRVGGLASSGRIWLREGRPLRAEVGERGATASGREAFYALLDVTAGRFDFHESESEGPDEIGAGVSALLLEHARLKDELSSA
jgi:uncharacterized protein (TIGR02266 family)